MIITGTGGTDFPPSGETTRRRSWCASWWCWALSFTLVLALLRRSNQQHQLTVFRQRLDTNLYIEINDIQPILRDACGRSCISRKGPAARGCKAALPHLSPALQIETTLYVHRHRVHFEHQNLEAPVKVRLAMAMEPKVLAPGEVAPNRHLYVISRDVISVGVSSHATCAGATTSSLKIRPTLSAILRARSATT